MARRRARKAPAVLFAGDWSWDSHFQLAAAVRRSGMRAVRVIIGQSGPLPRHLRLIFDRTVTVSSIAALVDLPEILRDETVVDVQAIESVAVAVCSAACRLPAAPNAASLMKRASSVDKFVVSETLRAFGIAAPATLAADSCSPREAAARLGLPMVVKPRVGNSGNGIHIARTLAELEAVVARQERPADSFFEQFVAGRSLNVGVLAPSDEVGIGVVWEAWARRGHLGPSSAIETIEHAALSRLGKDVIAALQLRGLVAIGVIEDADGKLWVHDVNPRVWGSFAAFTEAGVDFAAGYVAWLRGEGNASEPRWAAPGVRAWVFPDEIKGVMVKSSRPLAFLRLVRSLHSYRKSLGWRYVAFIVVGRRVELRHVLTARRRAESAET